MVGLRKQKDSTVVKVLYPDEHRLRVGDIVSAPLIKSNDGPILTDSGRALAKNPMEKGPEIIFVESPNKRNSWENLDDPPSLKIIEDNTEGDEIVGRPIRKNDLDTDEEKSLKDSTKEEYFVDDIDEIFSDGRKGSWNELLRGHL